MVELKNNIAVITGAASGIGYATARALAAEGMKLVLADVEERALASALKVLTDGGATAIASVVDVSNKAAVDELADTAWSTFGAVHVLFNNAGVAVFGPIHEMSHEDWRWTLGVNLWGPIHGVEVFAPRMVSAGQGGHMLFTASFAGLIPNANLGPYSVSKAAVVALAECVRKDLKAHGISASVVCPMRVATNVDQSYRNRPAELGGPGQESSYTDIDLAAIVGATLDADLVAALILDGMKRDDLFIHTHKDALEFVRRRHQRIEAAFSHAQ